MKCEHPSLYAALLVGVLVNVLLRSQTAYWCRAGAAAALVCAPVLAAVGALFAVSWRQGATPLLRLLFALLLAGTSVLELLRLWNLTQRLYPGAVTQLALCLLVLLPILYLRRVSAISQTAYVVLCLLCIATAGMLLSVFPRLHITNLQNAALIWPDFADAARDQLTLYPEYLLPALWPEPQKRGRHTLLWLAGVALGFDVTIHAMLELFYGAAMPLRADPLHAAARCDPAGHRLLRSAGRRRPACRGRLGTSAGDRPVTLRPRPACTGTFSLSSGQRRPRLAAGCPRRI